ncbi:ribonuclease P protein component [Roseobacter sp. YSTF-M11]|uniref:Ribonuclease P protein component n=1 Tax=Roseobacter insulae TaxID=2859783 RepID=A0A9X1FXE7_9RHOB|nr:ribonuclease P protein component [Roseobacter insulae]MBW4709865.1 ribonuclease P protein component [Roseobacter insulae]
MTPPQASPSGTSARGDTLPAVSLRLHVIRKRADFQRASRALRVAMPGFILQMRKRKSDEAEGIRVGFTCSKKVGNAVARNRAKRRLRAAARQVLPQQGKDGMDYVLIGRREATAALPFDQLCADLSSAVAKLQGKVT